MSLMFYNADINVYKRSSTGKKDMFGVIPESKLIYLSTIKAAVTPVSKTRAREDYGISSDETYEILVDPTDLFDEGTVVEYMGKKYNVDSIVDWSNPLIPDMNLECVQIVVSRIK